nr:unnamed protein product [Callosobruchus analis]
MPPRNIAQVMQDSVTQETPSFLIRCEISSAFLRDNCFITSEISPNKILEMIDSGHDRLRAKMQKTDCTNLNTRPKCKDKFSEEGRKKIFENYWQLGDVNRQRDFITKQVDMTQKARTQLGKQNGNSSDE